MNTMPGSTRYQQQPKNGEYDLRDNVIDRLGGKIKYSSGTFRRYERGIWRDVHELEVRHEVAEELRLAETIIGVKPTYSLEKNITEAIKSKVYTREDEWNRYPHVLVFDNCALDTRTMKRVEHSPQYMSTVALPYTFDPEATAPTWEIVLRQLLGEDEQRFLQEFAGYCLTSSVKHQMTLWLVGPPGGGKSTLIAGLEAMLGELAGSLGLSQLQGSGSRFALGHILGKTMLTCTENPRGHIKVTDTLNALITGDTLQVEQKYKNPVSYNNTAKLVWAMNGLPGLYDANNGLFRRVKVLELGKAITHKDPDVIDRVRIEGAGIVNWALDGLARLNERGWFTYPDSVKDATSRFRDDNDLQGQFLEQRCERAPSEQLFYTEDYRAYAARLTEAFNQWAGENGHSGKWSTKALKSEWERLGLKKGNRDKHGQPWYGVRVV